MLVELGLVEQRYAAVREVLEGASVTEVARRNGVARQTVHDWLKKYAAGGMAALVDRSSKPLSCAHQISATVEARIVELRRAHPGWDRERSSIGSARRAWRRCRADRRCTGRCCAHAAEVLDQAVEDLTVEWSADRRQRWVLDVDEPAVDGRARRPSLARRTASILRLAQLGAERDAVQAVARMRILDCARWTSTPP